MLYLGGIGGERVLLLRMHLCDVDAGAFRMCVNAVIFICVTLTLMDSLVGTECLRSAMGQRVCVMCRRTLDFLLSINPNLKVLTGERNMSPFDPGRAIISQSRQ